MSSRSVLIVDDSDSICDTLALVLEKGGFTTHKAYDGEEGVALAREHRPDVILLDIMMPRLDGWGAIEVLRSDPATARIPVIALTALRLTEAQVRAAGFVDYLSKPVTSHRLREAVRQACWPDAE